MSPFHRLSKVAVSREGEGGSPLYGLYGCAAGQDMAFVLSVLNRVYNFAESVLNSVHDLCESVLVIKLRGLS